MEPKRQLIINVKKTINSATYTVNMKDVQINVHFTLQLALRKPHAPQCIMGFLVDDTPPYSEDCRESRSSVKP